MTREDIIFRVIVALSCICHAVWFGVQVFTSFTNGGNTYPYEERVTRLLNFGSIDFTQRSFVLLAMIASCMYAKTHRVRSLASISLLINFLAIVSWMNVDLIKVFAALSSDGFLFLQVCIPSVVSKFGVSFCVASKASGIASVLHFIACFFFFIYSIYQYFAYSSVSSLSYSGFKIVSLSCTCICMGLFISSVSIITSSTTSINPIMINDEYHLNLLPYLYGILSILLLYLFYVHHRLHMQITHTNTHVFTSAHVSLFFNGFWIACLCICILLPYYVYMLRRIVDLRLAGICRSAKKFEYYHCGSQIGQICGWGIVYLGVITLTLALFYAYRVARYSANTSTLTSGLLSSSSSYATTVGSRASFKRVSVIGRSQGLDDALLEGFEFGLNTQYHDNEQESISNNNPYIILPDMNSSSVAEGFTEATSQLQQV